MIGHSDNETNFPDKLLLTNRQVGNLRRAFAKNTSTNIKLSKTQLSKMMQSGGVNFAENNLTDSFNFKVKMACQTGDDGTKIVEIMVPLKYLSNFWRTLEMPLINCEINLILTWSTNDVIVSANVVNQNATFAITDRKLYVPVVTLSTQDNY